MDKQEWGPALERIQCAVNMLQNSFIMTQALFSGAQPDAPPTLLDMNEVVENFLFVLKPMIKKHRVVVSFSAAEQLPMVKANESYIHQVLYNLFRNAIQTRSEIAIEIKTIFNHKNQMVNCQVADNGPGMDRDCLNSIFSLFFTTRAQGHGLGLYICKEIITRYQGSMTVQSCVGVGTRFTISLPAQNL
jgi:C4-dicarboxylate-specific signal transduction histidine kinase